MDLEVDAKKDGGLGWGKSLPVESVQEIVRRDWHSIPDRYIRDHVDRPKDEDLYHLSSSIPVIDFSLLSSGSNHEQRKLDLACKEWGFFQIVNHGITEETLKKMKIAVAGFYDLPLEEKKKYSMASDDLQGYGQAYVTSEEQKLDWGDLLFIMTLPTKSRKLNYWPIEAPEFVEAVEVYSMEVNRVAMELLANLSIVMSMDKEGLLRLHGEMIQAMRMNYYPTCCRPDLVLGVSPHSDSSSITILLQDEDITALQIQHNGSWVPVKPIPNALVVNIGDVIEAWSNGRYKSIEHRAITNATKARMSLATFVMPDQDAEIGPVDQMVEKYGSRMYKRIKYIDYIRHTLDRKMEGKVHTDYLKE